MNYKLLLYVCLVLCFGACERPDNTLKILELPSGSIYDVDNQESLLKIVINSNDDWQLTGASNWCVPDKTSGYGNDTLVLSIKANIFSQERKATLVVKNRDVRRAIRVTQKAAANEYIYGLPIIFHVLYNDPSDPQQNVATTKIYEILDQINAFYQNEDKSQNMGLEFIPATHDPNGNLLAESGINRISWPGSIEIDCNAFMKDPNNIQYLWDPNQYINVMIYAFTNENVLGISYLPYTIGTNGLPGLKNGDRYFIDPTLNYPHCVCINNKYLFSVHSILQVPDAVLTLTHELGHYLGLFHVFIGDPVDDYCDDTPNYDRKVYEDWLDALTQPVSFKELAMRTSTTGITFTSDNIMDYDYGYLDRFTLDQRKRVRHVLENSPLIPGPKAVDRRTRSAFNMEIPEARTIE
ncbi:zinc-dependent metalloproteinase lipoprotein [Bacteroides sp.]|uniref:zinc-dependent metalloproteinase lipoprotein n=1 Tax=Bacteroides sp. TaxID=29523 RepID=UPI0026156B4F|nr:zinc-dependent metalloproteinase lipoprotein [Bacteroides sp.]MDD3036556.1 zinc-dependent metalloproteinase lipoprotein [Bacteroides sp.]